MTEAFFMDYRSQGQTIPYVIVNIAKPPTETLTLFNVYVALSRSSRRSTICLLRDFDKEILSKPLDKYLALEDKRLISLDKETQVFWAGISKMHYPDIFLHLHFLEVWMVCRHN